MCLISNFCLTYWQLASLLLLHNRRCFRLCFAFCLILVEHKHFFPSRSTFGTRTTKKVTLCGYKRRIIHEGRVGGRARIKRKCYTSMVKWENARVYHLCCPLVYVSLRSGVLLHPVSVGHADASSRAASTAAPSSSSS